MDADPRAAYSYRHPRSGEWAHPLHADPIADAHASYVDPAWESLAPRVLAEPRGPGGGTRPWRAVVIGFGRGFECVALERRIAADGPQSHWEVVGLEPHPEVLQPWPPRWAGFAATEAPWWGMPPGDWPLGTPQRRLRVLPLRAEEWARTAAPAAWDVFLLDLFSPARHPDDWAATFGALLARAAAPGAVLTGYCCARSLRDSLQEGGWSVEVLRRSGQRDTLRARWIP